MKNFSKIKILPVLLIALFPAIVSGQITTRKLTFKTGTTSTAIKGSIKGRQIIDYALSSKKGDVLSVKLTTGNTAAYFNILPPGSKDVAIFIGQNGGDHFDEALTANGVYKIRVYLIPSAARRNESAAFTLNISVTHPAKESIDVKVPGTRFHATGKLSGAIGKASAISDFGVIRKPGGAAEVHVTFPNMKTRILIFSKGEWTCETDNCKLDYKRRGADEWEVIVNNTEHYYIPDAVITGG